MLENSVDDLELQREHNKHCYLQRTITKIRTKSNVTFPKPVRFRHSCALSSDHQNAPMLHVLSCFVRPKHVPTVGPRNISYGLKIFMHPLQCFKSYFQSNLPCLDIAPQSYLFVSFPVETCCHRLYSSLSSPSPSHLILSVVSFSPSMPRLRNSPCSLPARMVDLAEATVLTVSRSRSDRLSRGIRLLRPVVAGM